MIFKRFKKVASDVNDAVEFATNTQEAVKEQITESIVKRAIKLTWNAFKQVISFIARMINAIAKIMLPLAKGLFVAMADTASDMAKDDRKKEKSDWDKIYEIGIDGDIARDRCGLGNRRYSDMF
jgi:hypothetical protein